MALASEKGHRALIHGRMRRREFLGPRCGPCNRDLLDSGLPSRMLAFAQRAVGASASSARIASASTKSGAHGIFSENFGFLVVNRKQRRAAKSQGKAVAGRAALATPAGNSTEIADRFAAALSHHQAGRLAEAESLYRQICAVNPHHADSLHFLGVLAGQVGRNDIAIELIGRALAVQPEYAEAHYNLGHILANSADVHNSLGTVLSDQGKSAEAIAYFERGHLPSSRTSPKRSTIKALP